MNSFEESMLKAWWAVRFPGELYPGKDQARLAQKMDRDAYDIGQRNLHRLRQEGVDAVRDDTES